MLIEIHELEVHPIDFEEQYGPGAIDFGPDLRQVDDLRLRDAPNWSRNATASIR